MGSIAPPTRTCGCRKPRSSHAAWAYSWISPPSRSSRTTRSLAAGSGSGTAPTVASDRERGAAGAGCRAPRSPPALSRDAADPRSASGRAAHDVRCRSSVRRTHSLAAPVPASARFGCAPRRRSHRRCRELRVPVTDEELELDLLSAVCEVHEQVAGLLGHPRPGRVRRHAQDMNPARRQLHHEEHIQALEQDRVDMEEVAGQDALGLRRQELSPRPPRAAGCGVDAGPLENQPHGTRRDRGPEPGEFTLWMRR